MRAAVLAEYGTPRFGVFEEPVAAEGQSLVEVSAAGLNPIDVLWASGAAPDMRPPLPSVAGREGVGTVDGRRVYFNPGVAPHGSMSERTVVQTERLFEVPDGVSDGVGVALGIAGLAGWVSLEWRARLAPGEHVLVLGATGIVGLVAVQAARLLGAGRVVAAGRSAAGLERARAAGADATVELSGDDLTDRIREATGGRLDVIVDPLWGAPALAALHAATEGARLLQIGHSAAVEVSLQPGFMRRPFVSILGYSTGGVPLEVQRDAYARMAGHAAAGELTVDVEELPLSDVERAWDLQRSSPNVKLVLRP